MLSDAETDRSFQNKTRIPQKTHSWQCSDFTLLSWFAVLIQQVWPPKTSDGMLNIHPFHIIAYPELRVMSTNPSCLKVRLHFTLLLLCLFSHDCAFPATLSKWCEWDGITAAALRNSCSGVNWHGHTVRVKLYCWKSNTMPSVLLKLEPWVTRKNCDFDMGKPDYLVPRFPKVKKVS